MRKNGFIAALFCGAMLIATGTTGSAMAAETADTSASTADQQKFMDRDRLTETLMNDEQVDLNAAQATAESADTVLSDAEAELQKLNDKIAGLAADDPTRSDLEARATALSDHIENGLRPAANTADTALSEAQSAYNDELAVVTTQVQDMPENMVIAFNRSLNNAVQQDLVVNIDLGDIQAAIDGNYDRQQITALTKALEEEAKFARRSQVLADKAAETGNDSTPDQNETASADRHDMTPAAQRVCDGSERQRQERGQGVTPHNCFSIEGDRGIVSTPVSFSSGHP